MGLDVNLKLIGTKPYLLTGWSVLDYSKSWRLPRGLCEVKGLMRRRGYDVVELARNGAMPALGIDISEAGVRSALHEIMLLLLSLYAVTLVLPSFYKACLSTVTACWFIGVKHAVFPLMLPSVPFLPACRRERACVRACAHVCASKRLFPCTVTY